MEHATAHRLAQEIRQSEEYQTYHALKEEVMADETTAALLKDPGRAAELGRMGRRAVVDRYGWDGIGRRLLDLYRERFDLE